MSNLEIILMVALVLNLAIQLPLIIHRALLLRKIRRVCRERGQLLCDRDGEFFFICDDEKSKTYPRRSLKEANIRAIKIEEAATYNVPGLLDRYNSPMATKTGTWQEEQ